MSRAFTPDCGLQAATIASPNRGERAAGKRIDMLILHYTGMETAKAALERLCDREAEVSCHYVVDEDGTIIQMVPEAMRAWHAGLAHWRGESDINSRSIGIELVNRGHESGYPDFPAAQIESLILLIRDIQERHPIQPRHVLGHSDVAPERKLDPGEKFPWDRLFAAGIGHWVEPEPITGGGAFQVGEEGQPIEALQSMLLLYGYGVAVDGHFDGRTEAAVKAFQRHFRQARVDGIADVSTIKTLHKLLTKLPNL